MGKSSVLFNLGTVWLQEKESMWLIWSWLLDFQWNIFLTLELSLKTLKIRKRRREMQLSVER